MPELQASPLSTRGCFHIGIIGLSSRNKTITDANAMDKTKDIKYIPFRHKTKDFLKGIKQNTI
jgi:hypothetical protein